ncbi:MAG: sorbosone dehydrogenase family protein [Chitinophagaceae bacterium]
MFKLFLSPLTLVLCFLITTQSGQLSCNEKQTASAKNSTTPATNELFTKYNLDKIKLPPGFRISVFAEVPNARSMCWGSGGTLFVGNRSGNKVYAVVDADKNGVAENVYTIASGLTSPNGVAFKDGSLYVAEISRIIRFDDIENRLTNPPDFKVVYDKLPGDRHHGWKFIAFGPDDKLYVPVGAPCNICEREEPVYASFTRMNADGSGFEIFAHGIRNTVGFAWHPQTKELWFTDNGGDNLGDDIPADELNIASQKGMHFGFPYCHQGNIADKRLGEGKPCSGYVPPAINLGPHVAAIGMRFYTGNMFLPEYKNQVFIAEHGSWNRSTPIGYRVMLVNVENNKPTRYIPFATGWLQPDGKVLGRPADIEVAADGSLLVSDDDKGAIYRIIFEK